MKKALNQKTTKTSKSIFAFCFNIMIALLEVLAITFLFTIAIKRNPEKEATVGGWTSFYYFTTDSNILLLIASIISLIYIVLIWKGKVKKVPEWEYIFKLIAVLGTALTMFITLFVLLPGAIATKVFVPAALYLGSNLFMHLICPIVGIVTFLLFENREDIKLIKTLYALIPLVIYCIFYITMAYTHRKPDGSFMPGYDWYKFCKYGPGVMSALIVGILGFCYLFTWLLWLGNRKINLNNFK